jgi:hypothetical protein
LRSYIQGTEGRLLYDPGRIRKAVYANSQAAVIANLVNVAAIGLATVAMSILKGHSIPLPYFSLQHMLHYFANRSYARGP